MQYQAIETDIRPGSSWVPYAAAATAAAAVLVVGAATSSTGLWSAATVRPAVSSQNAAIPAIRGEVLGSSQRPQVVLQNQYSANAEVERPPNSVAATGLMAVGAGLSFLLLAALKAFNQTSPTPLQSGVIRAAEYSVALLATTSHKQPPADLKLHIYDHCPYCTRVELFLGWNGIKYERILYGYGDMEGPKVLTGKKQLPVLQGSGVWTPSGMSGLPESMDIIAWATKEYGCVLPPATGRKDVDEWQKKAKGPIASLSRPRMIKMPYRDFQKPEDIDYAFGKWSKKTGFVAEEALAATPQLLTEMEALLKDLEPLLKGEASLNPWGLGMDDILLLPDLRRLTCVKGLKWPAKVKNYVDKALNFPAMQCVSYEKDAF